MSYLLVVDTVNLHYEAVKTFGSNCKVDYLKYVEAVRKTYGAENVEVYFYVSFYHDATDDFLAFVRKKVKADKIFTKEPLIDARGKVCAFWDAKIALDIERSDKPNVILGTSSVCTLDLISEIDKTFKIFACNVADEVASKCEVLPFGADLLR